MANVFDIHPTHPQQRLLARAAEVLDQGGVVVYPTDTTYGLACHMGDKAALQRIIRLRRLPARHQFTLLCEDLTDIGTYARVDNSTYRLLKRLTPGAYTFILKATREVPRRILHEKRRTIGVWVPSHPIAQGLLAAFGGPLLTTTLRLPESDAPLSDPDEIRAHLTRHVDLLLLSGFGGLEESTVVDMTGGSPAVIRAGAGAIDW
ncbi:MAG: L-threonylcarbamoyladenylate synthase [Pseudomonadota bacterium]